MTPRTTRKPTPDPAERAAVVETIGVLDAIEWLDTQVKNRPLSNATIRRYAAEMLGGRWTLNGETIKFDDQGHLIDGQHRLSALALAGEIDEELTIRAYVVRGLPAETQLSMDQNYRRVAGQQVGMEFAQLGTSNGTFVAGVARTVYQFEVAEAEGEMIVGRSKEALAGNNAVVEWVAEHYQEMELAIAYRSKVSGWPVRPAVGAAMLIMFARKDKDAACEFFDSFASGANLPTHSPILALRNRLDKARKAREKLSDRDGMYYYITAWNAWIEHRSIIKLQRPTGEWMPRHFFIGP